MTSPTTGTHLLTNRSALPPQPMPEAAAPAGAAGAADTKTPLLQHFLQSVQNAGKKIDQAWRQKSFALRKDNKGANDHLNELKLIMCTYRSSSRTFLTSETNRIPMDSTLLSVCAGIIAYTIQKPQPLESQRTVESLTIGATTAGLNRELIRATGVGLTDVHIQALAQEYFSTVVYFSSQDIENFMKLIETSPHLEMIKKNNEIDDITCKAIRYTFTRTNDLTQRLMCIIAMILIINKIEMSSEIKNTIGLMSHSITMAEPSVNNRIVYFGTMVNVLNQLLSTRGLEPNDSIYPVIVGSLIPCIDVISKLKQTISGVSIMWLSMKRMTTPENYTIEVTQETGPAPKSTERREKSKRKEKHQEKPTAPPNTRPGRQGPHQNNGGASAAEEDLDELTVLVHEDEEGPSGVTDEDTIPKGLRDLR